MDNRQNNISNGINNSDVNLCNLNKVKKEPSNVPMSMKEMPTSSAALDFEKMYPILYSKFTDSSVPKEENAALSSKCDKNPQKIAMDPSLNDLNKRLKMVVQRHFNENGTNNDQRIKDLFFKEESGKQHFECEWANCNEIFINSEMFIVHVTYVHLEAEKESAPNFYCRWKNCKRTEPFSAKCFLVRHVRKHTGHKPYICQYVYEDDMLCMKAYSALQNLKIHQYIHTGERPYKCSFVNCKKSFTNSSNRSKHERRMHKGEKNYGCPVHFCPKEYADPSSLRKHVKDRSEPCIKGEHGDAENKELNKAKNFEVVGIGLYGTPFAMPSGIKTTNKDEENKAHSIAPKEENTAFSEFDEYLQEDANTEDG